MTAVPVHRAYQGAGGGGGDGGGVGGGKGGWYSLAQRLEQTHVVMVEQEEFTVITPG